MSRPSDLTLDHIDHPRNAGTIDEPDVVGKSSLDGRAPYTHMYLVIRGDRVEQAKFQTFGCAFSIAACSVVTELAKGRSTDDCLNVSAAKVIYCLGNIPEERRFSIDLAVQALHNAIRQWREKSQRAPANGGC